jgi:hypothetical protein
MESILECLERWTSTLCGNCSMVKSPLTSLIQRSWKSQRQQGAKPFGNRRNRVIHLRQRAPKDHLQNRLIVCKPIGEDLHLHAFYRFLACIAVGQHSGQLRHFRQPTAIVYRSHLVGFAVGGASLEPLAWATLPCMKRLHPLLPETRRRKGWSFSSMQSPMVLFSAFAPGST